MVELALIAGVVAAVAVTIACIKLYTFLMRAQAAVDRLGSEASTAVQAWAETARGVQRAAGKLEESLTPLGNCLCRVDRVTEKLEPDVLAVSVIQPAISRVSNWLGGFRRGLSDFRVQRPKGKAGEANIETEAG